MPKKAILYIDASGCEVKLALSEDAVFAGGRVSAEAALESFCESFAELVPEPSKISLFAICTGPGSMLGTRFASTFVSTVASLTGAKIAEWNGMRAAAFALSETRKVSEFSLFAPSKKGSANILNFGGGNVEFEGEIDLSQIGARAKQEKFLLFQRKNPPPEIANFKTVNLTPRQIFEVLERRGELLSPCSAPPDAKSFANREYVKWKAQARI